LGATPLGSMAAAGVDAGASPPGDLSERQLLARDPSLNPAAPSAPLDRPWSSGLCACLSHADSCCLACCCPCIQFGQNQERGFRSQRGACCKWTALYMAPFLALWLFDHMVQAIVAASLEASADDPRARRHAAATLVALTDLAMVTACVGVAVIAGRRRALLRAQHRIRGHPGADILVHCCCGCCALAQEARQIAVEERKALDLEAAGDGRGTHVRRMGPGLEDGMPPVPDYAAAAAASAAAAQPRHLAVAFAAEEDAPPLAQPVPADYDDIDAPAYGGKGRVAL